MSTLQLFLDAYWISPYSFSAFVALKEKGVPFEAVEIALQKGEQRLDKHAGTLITGKIPALRDGAFALVESSAIVEYLEERFAPPQHTRLLPTKLEDRARARMTLAWVRSDMLPIREERPTTTMFYEKAREPLSDKAAAAANTLLRLADTLIPDGSSYLFGDQWSIADADLAFMLQRLLLNGHEASAKIGDFVERQWARPSVREFVDKQRPPYTGY
jgi:glutathione S-transferase